MQKITWETKYIGPAHAFKEDDAVLEFCGTLISLGFSPIVTIAEES